MLVRADKISYVEFMRLGTGDDGAMVVIHFDRERFALRAKGLALHFGDPDDAVSYMDHLEAQINDWWAV